MSPELAQALTTPAVTLTICAAAVWCAWLRARTEQRAQLAETVREVIRRLLP